MRLFTKQFFGKKPKSENNKTVQDLAIVSLFVYLVLSWFEWRKPGAVTDFYRSLDPFNLPLIIFLGSVSYIIWKRWRDGILLIAKSCYRRLEGISLQMFLLSLLVLLLIHLLTILTKEHGSIPVLLLNLTIVLVSVVMGIITLRKKSYLLNTWEIQNGQDRTGKQTSPLKQRIASLYSGEGRGFATLIILIFLTGFILHIFAANWSKGHVDFHSGEQQFYSSIKDFSVGEYNKAIFKRAQSIVVYALGSINDLLFQDESGIFHMRLIISLITFSINFYILASLRKIRFLKISKRGMIYILLGFTFSYTILFYSSVIRPDIIILTIFNLFLFEYLKNGIGNLSYLVILSSIAMAFKGNGFLLPLILFSLVNWELIKRSYLIGKWHVRSFLEYNVLLITIYTGFLLLSPSYLKGGVFSFFESFIKGLDKFESGHYGLFATGKNPVFMYFERFMHFIVFFSPIIVLYFTGLVSFLYKSFKTLSLKKIIFFEHGRVILILLLSAVFFVFIIMKPIQFYRYYFPFATVFLTVALIALSQIKLKRISYAAVFLFLVYNSYFIYFILNNSRFNPELKSKELNIDYYEKDWILPDGMKVKGKLMNIDSLPQGEYLLITEMNKYTYDRIIDRRGIFMEKDFYGISPEKLNTSLAFYQDLRNLTLVYSTGKNAIWGIYLPYDVWYMNNPNYYIYQKN